MILCFASWDRPGGLNTMFRAYYERLSLSQPHIWILIGKTPPPPSILKNKNSYCFQVAEDWLMYEDFEKCEDRIVQKIMQLVREKNIKGIFLPLEYHFFPYLRNLDLPILYISHLLNKPLIHSARQQWYKDLAEVKSGIFTESMRLKSEEKALARSEYIICASPQVERELKKWYELPRLKEVILSSLGTDKEKWKDVGFGEADQLLYFGRLTHQKGIPNLSLKSDSALRLRVVGSGKLATWLRDRPFALAIEPRQEDVTSYLSQARFCLFPSHYEPWGLSLTEALAAGKICLAQKGVSGHELQIEDKKNGFLVDFGLGTLDEIIESISLSPLHIQQVSENAREKASGIESHLVEVQAVWERFYQRCH